MAYAGTKKWHPELDECLIQRVVHTNANGKERIIAGVYRYMGGAKKLGIVRQNLRTRIMGKVLDKPTWCFMKRFGRMTTEEWKATVSGVDKMLEELSASEPLHDKSTA